ncbi:MAG: hypothetical protein ACTSRP_18235 [Candidatus Helarchaeota archaeon]
MSEFDDLIESKILGLFKIIAAFGLDHEDNITADPWTPWPFP